MIDNVVACNPDSGLLCEFKKAGLSDVDIKRIFTDLIIAAGDTSASATQWALYLLARNKEEQSMFRKVVLGNENMATAEAKNIVRETLR